MRLLRLVLGYLTVATLVLALEPAHAALAKDFPEVFHCRPGALSLSIGRSSGAAGTTYRTLLIENHVKSTNSSSGTCWLSGIPATQFGVTRAVGTGIVVGGDFVGVGPAATKLRIAGRGNIVEMKSGAVASVTVGIETADNYVPSRCGKSFATRIRLVFQFGPTLYYSIGRTAVCTKLASTTTSGVVLGTHYP